jgi:hypothetical protein
MIKAAVIDNGIVGLRESYLDHYVDKLTEWLCGVKPEGRFEMQAADYGVAWAH